MIELEDFSEDIIGKAMRGLAITPPQLSALSGVGEQHIKALLEGIETTEAEIARRRRDKPDYEENPTLSAYREAYERYFLLGQEFMA